MSDCPDDFGDGPATAHPRVTVSAFFAATSAWVEDNGSLSIVGGGVDEIVVSPPSIPGPLAFPVEVRLLDWPFEVRVDVVGTDGAGGLGRVSRRWNGGDRPLEMARQVIEFPFSRTPERGARFVLYVDGIECASYLVRVRTTPKGR